MSSVYIDRKKLPPPGEFPIYYVPSSRTVSKRNPLKEFVPGASRGVLLLTVLVGNIVNRKPGGPPPGGGDQSDLSS